MVYGLSHWKIEKITLVTQPGLQISKPISKLQDHHTRASSNTIWAAAVVGGSQQLTFQVRTHQVKQQRVHDAILNGGSGHRMNITGFKSVVVSLENKPKHDHKLKWISNYSLQSAVRRSQIFLATARMIPGPFSFSFSSFAHPDQKDSKDGIRTWWISEYFRFRRDSQGFHSPLFWIILVSIELHEIMSFHVISII